MAVFHTLIKTCNKMFCFHIYRCLATNQLFVDPMFPPCDSSLYVNKSCPETKWIRASELVDDPRFFVGGASRFDINQGRGTVRTFDWRVWNLLAKKILGRKLPYHSAKIWNSIESPKTSLTIDVLHGTYLLNTFSRCPWMKVNWEIAGC